jgi:CubicO group peptidase (beta-lactamase class C family)
MIDAEMRLFLLGYPGVVDQIGARIYPALLPEDETLPAVVYTQISHNETYSNSGSCYSRLRYQIDSYAATLADARRLDDTVRAVMGGWRGRWGKWTVIVFQRNTGVERMENESTWRISSDYVMHVTG